MCQVGSSAMVCAPGTLQPWHCTPAHDAAYVLIAHGNASSPVKMQRACPYDVLLTVHMPPRSTYAVLYPSAYMLNTNRAPSPFLVPRTWHRPRTTWARSAGSSAVASWQSWKRPAGASTQPWCRTSFRQNEQSRSFHLHGLKSSGSAA